MTIFNTPARQKVNKYSSCYYPALTGALVKKGITLTSAADAKNIVWGYITGAPVDDCASNQAQQDTQGVPGCGPTEYNALISGSVDAVMDDLSSIAGRSQRPASSNYHVAAVFNLATTGAVPCPLHNCRCRVPTRMSQR